MKVREFLVQIPYLCGAKNAERIAEIFGFVFDRELEGGSAFSRNEHDRMEIGNRSRFLWAMLYTDKNIDVGAVDQCKALMEIIERTHYLDKHGEKEQEKYIDNLYAAVKDDESAYPEIAAIMPVEDAITMSYWNG